MRKFGWKRDLPDYRDYMYRVHPEYLEAPPLPSHVDLREGMSPIEDQGQLGSCVAHATVGNLEFLELQAIKGKIQAPMSFGPDFHNLSRLFVYYNARAIDGDTDQDNGTQLRSAVMAIRKRGICREVLWPYNTPRVFQSPAPSAYSEGLNHKILFAYRIDNTNLNAMKQCLANGFPFILGISVYSSFMSQEVAKTGIIPMPTRQDSFEGGHALMCVGYDENNNFIIRNSWGKDWGMSGYCLIKQGYLLNPHLASDFWTLRKVSPES